MSIYVVTHKKYNPPKDDFYKTLLVGAYKGHSFGDYFDDENDNISNKNTNYCELTGIYWIWKNIGDDIVGIVHYRRYFSCALNKNRILSEKQIRKKLKNYDIILPNKVRMKETVKEQLLYTYDECVLSELRNVIEQKYPEYLMTYDKIMADHDTYFCNMMICKKNLYNQYCQWLFDILFEFEKKIDVSEFDSYQKRIFGFMSERLLTVWVMYHKLSVCELGIVNTEQKDNPIKEMLRSIRRLVSYYLT